MCNTFAYFILFTLTSDSFGYVEPQIISLHSETSSDNEKTKLFFGKKYINKKIEELDEHNEDDNYANWRKHDNKHVNIRRRYSSSSETEEKIHWKDEWKEKWKNIKKLADSMNMSNVDKGDRVNMVAARPWGVPCGDPNQHDVPWGSCMLPMECESEYRIYRGDFFCGRTEFVCCSILLNTYDLYHGLIDVSLSDSSLQTDSDELKVTKNKHSKKKDQKRSKKQRQKMRHKRKKAIKKLIKKTVQDIGKILNKTYKFGTKARIRKTNQLKKFVKKLKEKYKKDRQTVKDIHEIELHKIDDQLNKGIINIREINRDLVYNNSIHKWVVNGTLSRNDAKILRSNYPNIWKDLSLSQLTRRNKEQTDDSNMKYDIEYGLLYN